MKGRWSLVILLTLLAAAAGLRLTHLGADGPTRFPNGLTDLSPIEDEAAKGFAARSRVWFGAWSPSPADDYRFWEILSPVFVWAQYGWFRAFGATLASGRAFSAAVSLLGIIGIYLVLGARSRPAALMAAGLGAVNFYAVIFGREALLETPLNTLLIIAFALQLRSGRRPWLLVAAAIAWLAAWLVKQSAVTYLPVLIAGGVLMAARPAEGKRRWAALMAAGLVAAAAFALLAWPDYRLRTIMNARHTLDYRPDPSFRWMAVDPGRTWAAVRANLGLDFLRGYLLLDPVAAPLALAELGLIAFDRLRKRRVDRLALLAGLWWLSARASLSVQGQDFPRFYLIQLPSMLILAGLALGRLSRARCGWARLAPAAVMAAAVLINLAPWLGWVRDNPREIERGTWELTALIGPRPATVCGKYAAALTFDTGYRFFYLKSVFNREPEQMRALGFTHLLVAADMEQGDDIDPAARRLAKAFPAAFAARREVGRIRFQPGASPPRELILYQLDLE